MIENHFPGVESAAVWQDLKLGFSHMNRWGRIATVTDIDWIENSINVFKLFWPGHLRQFDLDEYEKAKAWVSDDDRVALNIELNRDDGILTLIPSETDSLTEYDFESITSIVDAYLQDHPKINGIMIHSRHFPGWQGIASMISHLKFVKDHHRKIERVAIVTNSPLGKFSDHVTDHFIKAQVKSFDYDQQDIALKWLRESA